MPKPYDLAKAEVLAMIPRHQSISAEETAIRTEMLLELNGPLYEAQSKPKKADDSARALLEELGL